LKTDPETPLPDLGWVPPNRLRALARLGIHTAGCLLRNYPRRYEDRRAFPRFPDSEMEEPVCLRGEIVSTSLKRFGRGRGVFEATVGNTSGGIFSQPLVCRWFNMPYMQGVLMAGQEVVLFGRPKEKSRRIVIDHPEYEVIDGEESGESIHMRRIVPVHPAGEGITPRQMRALVFHALGECDLDAVSLLGGTREAVSLPGALRTIHFPESFGDLPAAREQLALEECFVLQVLVRMRRARWGAGGGVAKPCNGELVVRLLDRLDFKPTACQHRVIDEIRRELASGTRMHRLLQGDVGSGKTLVALAAMLHTIEAGHAAAIMAPTQILAEQHHANFARLLEPLGVRLAIRTAARKTSDAPLLESGPGLLVGTHALLHDSPKSLDAGLVVIDEQHKFGVLQRARLVNLPSRPDVLVMTATPIPRTLAQTVYGDLDVSVLDEKPAGRGPVRTVVRPSAKIPEVAAFLRGHLAGGRQAYIVYALIDESEKLAAKAAAAEFGKWRELLAPHAVALLHGRTPQEERERTMRAFRSGAVAALVSTTVIEVGVDVPNASLLLVENAERFGLAQLHQLRGRIGRGTEKSYCILLHDTAATPSAADRLAVLERTSDGFEVAEEDLRLRGPGNLMGTAQAGLPPLKIADLANDGAVMKHAAALAADILERDPALREPANSRLRAVAARTMAGADAASG
jgi:ATP-dependent DNA helicase RecG